MTRDEARRRVHGAGMRATGPRLAVLQLLTNSARPLSHNEVTDALGGGDWDKATLYRNLIRLVEGNLARVASQVGGVIRYEAQREGDEPHLHPHFACRVCGTVQCLPDTSISMPRDPNWQKALVDAELQIVGKCPDCRKMPKRGAQRRAKK